MAFLIMMGIIAIEFLLASFIHTQFGISLYAIAVVGIFIGWGNAFLYMALDNN